MTEQLAVLLVHEKLDHFESLKRLLKEMSIETYSVRNCQAAHDLICQHKPHVIFTESSLSDGSWQSLLAFAETAQVPVGVIVVGAVPDVKFYISVMEQGAFDFVAPPFEHEPLGFVIRSAGLDVHRRRNTTAVAAV